jgi:hypothetical protein
MLKKHRKKKNQNQNNALNLYKVNKQTYRLIKFYHNQKTQQSKRLKNHSHLKHQLFQTMFDIKSRKK